MNPGNSQPGQSNGPPPCPPGWTADRDGSQDAWYFRNDVTGGTVWEFPGQTPMPQTPRPAGRRPMSPGPQQMPMPPGQQQGFTFPGQQGMPMSPQSAPGFLQQQQMPMSPTPSQRQPMPQGGFDQQRPMTPGLAAFGQQFQQGPPHPAGPPGVGAQPGMQYQCGPQPDQGEAAGYYAGSNAGGQPGGSQYAESENGSVEDLPPHGVAGQTPQGLPGANGMGSRPVSPHSQAGYGWQQPQQQWAGQQPPQDAYQQPGPAFNPGPNQPPPNASGMAPKKPTKQTPEEKAAEDARREAELAAAFQRVKAAEEEQLQHVIEKSKADVPAEAWVQAEEVMRRSREETGSEAPVDWDRVMEEQLHRAAMLSIDDVLDGFKAGGPSRGGGGSGKGGSEGEGKGKGKTPRSLAASDRDRDGGGGGSVRSPTPRVRLPVPSVQRHPPTARSPAPSEPSSTRSSIRSASTATPSNLHATAKPRQTVRDHWARLKASIHPSPTPSRAPRSQAASELHIHKVGSAASLRPPTAEHPGSPAASDMASTANVSEEGDSIPHPSAGGDTRPRRGPPPGPPPRPFLQTSSPTPLQHIAPSSSSPLSPVPIHPSQNPNASPTSQAWFFPRPPPQTPTPGSSPADMAGNLATEDSRRWEAFWRRRQQQQSQPPGSEAGSSVRSSLLEDDEGERDMRYGIGLSVVEEGDEGSDAKTVRPGSKGKGRRR